MVTVFGLGFVGLTTALGFAHLGYDVYGVDVDEERKAVLRQAGLPFYEPHMKEVLERHLNQNFFVTDNVEEAVSKSDYLFFCVGTPYGRDGSADLTYLFGALDTAIDAVNDGRRRVLVVKSTVPPSTTAEKIWPYVQGKGEKAARLGVTNNPEFLREGHCWEDFIHADRIVVGCNDATSARMMTELYAPMNIPVKLVSHSTGEFVKYLSNTLLATLISFSNEMALAADAVGGIETAEAFRILHMDKRWENCPMTAYVYPGCGYGGYCLPKDTNAFLAQARQKGYEPAVLREVIAVNDGMAGKMAQKIIRCLPADRKNGTIGILGLSFKPGSDDVRDTPASRIIRKLREVGYTDILAYDPVAEQEFSKVYADMPVKMCGQKEEIYQKADVLAIVTAWEEFASIREETGVPVVDCRYML